MARRTTGGFTGVVVLAAGFLAESSGSAAAQAKGPAFDCTKASGAIEKLICGDEGLSALDRKLDGVYKAALAKARDDMPTVLRAEQRGWVKGRDECWKAKGEDNPVFLTESWKATTERACVEGQYQIRIAEIQVQYQLAPSKKPVFFACNNDPRNEVVATFFETDPPAARFERGDRTVIAWQVRTATGARYEGQNLSAWTKANETTVRWLDEELRCQPRNGPPTAAAQVSPLADTEWRLVEIRSMDDSVGIVRPDDPSLYTMRLNGDGTVAMRLNCNRANGSWSAEASAHGSSGRFEFGPLAATRALCPPPSLDERVTSQAQYVRGYLLKDGRLHLSLMADGGIHVWEPQTEVPFETVPDKTLEAAILRASPFYTRKVERGRYVYARVDLNGDGRDEVFVYLLGSIFCGTGGCNLLLFTEAKPGYSLVNEFPISRTPVIVAPETTSGWSDLLRLESGGGAAASYVRHTFDGKHYVRRERLPEGTAPKGKRCLAGELTFQKGIPLEPQTDEVPAASRPEAPAPSKTGFSTVCGVTVGGKEYRYKCTVEGAVPGASGQTVLHFPDNTVTLTWLGGGKATATFAGMNPQGITFTTTDGVTRFTFEDKVYFYASDRNVAAAQLKALR